MAYSNGAEIKRTTRSMKLYKPRARNRITNGRGLLHNIDHRTVWARRFRDLLSLHSADLGGADRISEAERSLLRRACTLMVELERLEMLFAAGEAETALLDAYQRAANTLRRLLSTLGLQRRQRDITPTLAQYLARKNGRDEVIDVEAAE
jgi:hypothetical protein